MRKFFKKTTAVALTCAFAATMFAGCGKSDTQITTLDSNKETEATTTTTQAETTTAQTGTKIHSVTISSSITSLSNESIPMGTNANDRDDKNVPNGIYYYQKLYGNKYGALYIMDTSQPVMYLTFDEGYENGDTPKILDTLKEKGVKATFFITKGFFDSSPELIQRMLDEGHIVGNHTCAHPSGGMPTLSNQEQMDDVLTLNKLVQDKFGYEMRLFRYPEGTFSEQSLQLFHEMGFTPVFWSFAHKDYDTANQPDPTEALANIEKCMHPGAIYLLHAVSDTNTQILGQFIDDAKAAGYSFGQFETN